MQTFKTIRDEDFGLDTPKPKTWTKRKTGRAIIFDENKNVALLHVTKKRYHKLPGGGVEERESIAEALQREAIEEIGCEIGDIRELGIIEEYRNNFSKHQTSYCFVATVKGKKKAPDFTQEEIANGFEVVWLELDGSIKTLEEEIDTIEDYEGKFINARELAFLKEAKKFIAEQK